MIRNLSQTTAVLMCMGILLTAGSPAASPIVPLQAGGELGDAVVVGDLAYLGQGPAVSVWELAPSGDAAPVHLATAAPLPGLVRGLAVSGDYLFASWRTNDPYGGLAVYSLAVPDQPVFLFDFEYNASSYRSPGGMAVVGDTLFFTDSEGGVFSIDISDPLAPVVNSQVFTFGLQRLAVTGTHLVGWGAGWTGFAVEVMNIADVAAPATVGYYSSWGNFNDGAVDGDVMVLVGDGFEVVSLADPAMPTMLTTVASAGTYVRSVLLHDGNAYLGDENGVQVWDMSDPATPVAGVLVADAPADRTERAALHTIVGGTEAVMFTGMGLGYGLDLGDPANPDLEFTFDLPVGTDSWAVVDRGGEVVVSDFYSGLRVMDHAMASLGRFDPDIAQGGYQDIDVDGSTAYLVAWGFGLITVDLSTPAVPAALGDAPFSQASAVEVMGETAYLVSSDWGSAFLQAFSVVDPTMPTPMVALPISKGWDVVHHGDLLLVADENAADTGGLRLFDITSPNAPVQIGHYSVCNSAGGVAAHDDLAFVACFDGSLHVVSLADPTLPTQLGEYSDPSVYFQGSRVGVDNDVVWFGHDKGVDLLDVSDPTTPRLIERIELASTVRGIDIAEDGNGWVAASTSGVYRIEPVVFRDGFESSDLSAWSIDP